MEDNFKTSALDFGTEFLQLEKAIINLGFDGVLYSFYPRPMHINSQVQPVLHFSSQFHPFIEHYIKNDYGNRDFVLRLALQGQSEPIDWWKEIEAGNVSEDEIEVTASARTLFNIQHGLSIPVLSGSFAIAGISVISKNPRRAYFEKLIEKHSSQLFKFADEYHRTIIKSKAELQFFIEPLLSSLSDTKKTVLKHLMTGKPMKSIGTDNDITPRYAEKLLVNIRKEFGNISSYELMYILGMINMHKYL